jgi:hypothetical protein
VHYPSKARRYLAKYVVALLLPLLESFFFARPSYRMRGISLGSVPSMERLSSALHAFLVRLHQQDDLVERRLDLLVTSPPESTWRATTVVPSWAGAREAARLPRVADLPPLGVERIRAHAARRSSQHPDVLKKESRLRWLGRSDPDRGVIHRETGRRTSMRRERAQRLRLKKNVVSRACFERGRGTTRPSPRRPCAYVNSHEAGVVGRNP